MPDFYRVEEVAEKLKVSVQAVYKWCREGKLPVYRFEKCVRIHTQDLDEFCRERRTVGRNRYA